MKASSQGRSVNRWAGRSPRSPQAEVERAYLGLQRRVESSARGRQFSQLVRLAKRRLMEGKKRLQELFRSLLTVVKRLSG